MSDLNENETSDRFPRSCLILILLILSLPFLFHGFHGLIDAITRARIDKQYTIEYSDVVHKMCLYNGLQNFVCDPKVAYWNKDTLLISDGAQCFLIELEKRIDKDEMEEIPCGNLKNVRLQQPIEVWRKN